MFHVPLAPELIPDKTVGETHNVSRWRADSLVEVPPIAFLRLFGVVPATCDQVGDALYPTKQVPGCCWIILPGWFRAGPIAVAALTGPSRTSYIVSSCGLGWCTRRSAHRCTGTITLGDRRAPGRVFFFGEFDSDAFGRLVTTYRQSVAELGLDRRDSYRGQQHIPDEAVCMILDVQLLLEQQQPRGEGPKTSTSDLFILSDLSSKDSCSAMRQVSCTFFLWRYFTF